MVTWAARVLASAEARRVQTPVQTSRGCPVRSRVGRIPAPTFANSLRRGTPLLQRSLRPARRRRCPRGLDGGSRRPEDALADAPVATARLHKRSILAARTLERGLAASSGPRHYVLSSWA